MTKTIVFIYYYYSFYFYCNHYFINIHVFIMLFGILLCYYCSVYCYYSLSYDNCCYYDSFVTINMLEVLWQTMLLGLL